MPPPPAEALEPCSVPHGTGCCCAQAPTHARDATEGFFPARGRKLPWHDDSYRRCEYTVDWASGRWSVDDSRSKRPRAECVS